jgi:hypothetical protein
MEAIASQMRGYALAADGLLPEYSASRSPGERLVAIAFLQIKTNKDYFNWLSDRFSIEVPFLQYHAAVALRNAVSTMVAVPPEERAIFRQVLGTALDNAKASAESHEVDISKSESILVLNDALSIFSR